MKAENVYIDAALKGFFGALKLGWTILLRVLKLFVVIVVILPYIAAVLFGMVILAIMGMLCWVTHVPFLRGYQIESIGEFFIETIPEWFRDLGELK